MRQPTILPATATVLLCVACADTARTSDRWLGSIDTLPGGVLHVDNPARGMWAGENGWKVVEDERIGAASGDTPDVFGEVAAVGVSPQGLIHVIDGHAQEVRVFAPTGEHVRTFGRRGAGPGEFENAYSLDWDGEGRLWIIDPGNNRYAVYDTAGSRLFHAARTVPGVVFPWLGGFARSGAFYDVAASQGRDGVALFTYYRVAETGAVEAAAPPIEHRHTGPPSRSMLLFWLTPRTTFAFDARGYLWVAHTGDYRIIQRSLDGDTVRIVTRAHSKTPVSQAERDSIAKELQSAPAGDASAPIPSTRPVIERIFVDPGGNLYVKRFGNSTEAPASFDVFDAEGRFLGPMRSDVAFAMFPSPPRFTSTAIYGVVTDSLGVQYVVRARVERSH